MPRVGVCIVTYNSQADLGSCLAALDRLATDDLEIIVVDCASSDRSAEIARTAAIKAPLQVVQLEENIGFAGGMNVAIGHTDAPYILSLNADVRPSADFVNRLLDRFVGAEESRIAAVTGRLQRPESNGPRLLDAAGMRLAATWRHFDRGSNAVDGGQFSEPEQVFGATGAATLFARQALEDVAVDGEYFLEEFHSFREDAELCFRLRERGWKVIYEPRAQAVHRRTNLPERRSEMTAAVNYHSLKNRYLLRIYHQTPSNILLTLVPTVIRDLGIAAYVLTRERSSLAAYRWLWTHRTRLKRRRRAIQQRRRMPARALNSWFLRSSRPL